MGGIWGQARNLDDQTLARWTCPSAGRTVQAGCGARIWGQTRCRVCPIWGQTRCPVYRSGTFNAQRSTLDFQWGDRKGGWWAGCGDRHGIWATEPLARQSCQSTGRLVEAGCGTQIWGQTRCPVYRSVTFNAQRSTLNFQRGDRKGAWWARYGDRHEIWTTGLLTWWT